MKYNKQLQLKTCVFATLSTTTRMPAVAEKAQLPPRRCHSVLLVPQEHTTSAPPSPRTAEPPWRPSFCLLRVTVHLGEIYTLGSDSTGTVEIFLSKTTHNWLYFCFTACVTRNVVEEFSLFFLFFLPRIWLSWLADCHAVRSQIPGNAWLIFSIFPICEIMLKWLN